MVFWLLLAQSQAAAQVAAQSPDPISGGAGWVGAGLLGMVLSWLLLIHLPAKDKQIRDLVDSKDKQLEILLKQKWEMVQAVVVEHRKAIQDVAAHCEKEMVSLSASFGKELDRFGTEMEKLSRAIVALTAQWQKQG